MDLWGLFGAVSHAEELSHTCLHKCNFSVYVCACVHAFMYTCEHSRVCARACAHTHTQHTGKDQKSKDNFQLSLSQSTQAKVQEQPSALFHLFDEAETLVSTPCALRNQTDTVGPSTGLSASLRTNFLTSAGSQCPSMQELASLCNLRFCLVPWSCALTRFCAARPLVADTAIAVECFFFLG